MSEKIDPQLYIVYEGWKWEMKRMEKKQRRKDGVCVSN